MRAEGAMEASTEAVELAGARFGFGELQVLAGVDLRIEPGEVVAVVGPSGCGKTTLLELVAGLREADSGHVRIGGEERERLRLAALMPQTDSLLPWLAAIDNA